VIDEVQRRPALFPLPRVLADHQPLPARFLIPGSASPDLSKQSSETLAGCLETATLEGFRLADLGAKSQTCRWVRGGLLLSFTARMEADSLAWRRQFLQTFLERDIPPLGITILTVVLRRFWNLVAHYHGQIWNAAELRPEHLLTHKPAGSLPSRTRCLTCCVTHLPSVLNKC